MTSVETAPGAQVATIAQPSVDLDRVARLGMWLAAAESNSTDPKAKGMAAALRIGYAEAMGLPAHAAAEVHLIKGNLSLSAKLCRALAHQHGLRVVKVKETPDSCSAAVVTDAGKTLGETTYTLAMAKKAGLSGDNWTKRPDRMLWARASKQALDDYAPWVTVGVLSLEQAEELDGTVPVRVADAEVIDPDLDDDDVPFGDQDE